MLINRIEQSYLHRATNGTRKRATAWTQRCNSDVKNSGFGARLCLALPCACQTCARAHPKRQPECKGGMQVGGGVPTGIQYCCRCWQACRPLTETIQRSHITHVRGAHTTVSWKAFSPAQIKDLRLFHAKHKKKQTFPARKIA